MARGVQLWDCNRAPQQTWRVVQWPDGQYKLESMGHWNSPACLDADTNGYTSNGLNRWNNATRVQLWHCQGGNGGWLHQEEWPEVTFGAGRFVASMELTTPVHNGPDPRRGPAMCLDADANHLRTNGDTVQLWQCLDGGGPRGEQLWAWEPA